MKAALKLYVGELIAGYLIGRAWLELVDLTAKHVRKTQKPRELVLNIESSLHDVRTEPAPPTAVDVRASLEDVEDDEDRP